MADATEVVPLVCKSCRCPFGTMDVPGPEVFASMLARTPFATLATMIPANVANLIAQRLTFECGRCYNESHGRNGSGEG